MSAKEQNYAAALNNCAMAQSNFVEAQSNSATVESSFAMAQSSSAQADYRNAAAYFRGLDCSMSRGHSYRRSRGSSWSNRDDCQVHSILDSPGILNGYFPNRPKPGDQNDWHCRYWSHWNQNLPVRDRDR
jgi:hypothetical protein